MQLGVHRPSGSNMYLMYSIQHYLEHYSLGINPTRLQRNLCTLIFACLCLHFSCPLHDSVMQHSPLWHCICKLWDASMWTTCWCKTVMPALRWDQSQSFRCSHDLTGKVTIGHSLNILLRLWMPRWLDHLEGYPNVVKIYTWMPSFTIIGHLYMETKPQDTQLYQGLATTRLRLVVSEDWLFLDEAS